MHVKSHGGSCDVWTLENFLFSSFWLIYKWMFVTFGKHLHLDRKKLYECELLWNRIVKGMEIFVLKSFGVVHVKFMVGE